MSNNITPTSESKRHTWLRIRKDRYKLFTAFFLSLVLSLTMALLTGFPPPGTAAIFGMGGSFATAFGMSSLGATALAVSTAFLILALCLSLILVVYGRKYWRKRKEPLDLDDLPQAPGLLLRTLPPNPIELKYDTKQTLTELSDFIRQSSSATATTMLAPNCIELSSATSSSILIQLNKLE